jgi:hypothetical protein
LFIAAAGDTFGGSMHVECGNCGASMQLEPHLRTANCPYCASPSVVERGPAHDRPAPTFTLGFTVAHEGARTAVRHWQKSRGIFTHSGLKGAQIEDIKGLYVPAYLYSAVAHADYQAEIGENYQETETYTTTDSKGNLVTRTRTVTKTEWRHLQGRHSSYVLDVLVTASRGVNNAELELVEPFDYKTLRRYTPAILSGWIAEDPTMTQAECIALARQETMDKVSAELTKFMPGDSHRSLNQRTYLERETIDLVHVPVWVLAARYDAKKPPVRVLVNGQTSKVWGKAPLSWIKITLAVLAVVLPVAALIIWSSLTADSRPTPAPTPQRPAPAPTTPATTPVTPAKPATPVKPGTPAKPGAAPPQKAPAVTPGKPTGAPTKPPPGAAPTSGATGGTKK